MTAAENRRRLAIARALGKRMPAVQTLPPVASRGGKSQPGQQHVSQGIRIA